MPSKNTKKSRARCDNCLLCNKETGCCDGYLIEGHSIEIPYIDSCPKYIRKPPEFEAGKRLTPEESLRKYMKYMKR